MRDAQDLLLRFHGARPGHHQEVPTPDSEIFAQPDDRQVAAQRAVDELVGLGNRHYALHAWKAFEQRFEASGVRRAHGADGDRRVRLYPGRRQTELANPLADRFHLSSFRFLRHFDQHGFVLPWKIKKPTPVGSGPRISGLDFSLAAHPRTAPIKIRKGRKSPARVAKEGRLRVRVHKARVLYRAALQCPAQFLLECWLRRVPRTLQGNCAPREIPQGEFMASFPGVDFIEFDSLLNDEEKL